MRVLVAVLMLALSLGYSFRVEDVFDIFEAGINIPPQNGMIMDPKIGVLGRKCVNLGSLQSLNCFIFFLLKARDFLPECWQNIEPAEDFVVTERQGDSLSDNIPAVFAVTFGASLLANVLFGKGGEASANDVPSQGIDICQARQDYWLK